MPKTQKSKRKPLSKAMLLPLSADFLQQLQLKHHLALVAIRDGQGSPELTAALLNAIYLSFYLHSPCDSGDMVVYQQADAALQAYMERKDRDENFLHDTERDALEKALAIYDTQLAAVPLHRYMEAFDRLHRFVESGGDSPIPAPACETV